MHQRIEPAEAIQLQTLGPNLDYPLRYKQVYFTWMDLETTKQRTNHLYYLSYYLKYIFTNTQHIYS